MAENQPKSTGFEALYDRLDEAGRTIEREEALTPAARHEVLAARTRALAEARTETQGEVADVLGFRVGGERYAVEIGQVDEVLEIRGLFPLLGAPRQVLGAILARARVLPVLDLRHLLGLEGGGMSDLTRVVVVGIEPELFGLAVEEVEGRLELPRGDWQRPATGPFLHVTADRLAVLDLQALSESGAAKPQAATAGS